MARVSAKTRAIAEADTLLQTIRLFLNAKVIESEAKKSQEEPKKAIVDFITQNVEEDEKGHRTFALPEEFSGFAALQYQRKVKRVANEDAAERISNKHNLGDELYTTIQVLDEGKVFAALYDKKISIDEVEEMFPETVTYALVPQKP
jgi:hypothetical protein